MRPLVFFATFVLIAAGVTAIAADKSYPIYTADNFVDSMKLCGRNFRAVGVAIGKNDFDSAKAQLVRTRELLAVTITFWRDRKKEDAIKMLRNTLTNIDALDTVLSAEMVDASKAGVLATQIGADCQACHALYRVQDPQTKSYRFKPGLVQ